MATKKRKLSESADADVIRTTNPGGVDNVTQSVVRPKAFQSVGRDNPLYSMTRGKRGYCFIFKMEEYGRADLNRRGASHDAEKCRGAFTSLEFEVIEFPNLGKEDFLDELKNIQKMRLDNCGCLVLIYMGHGRRDQQTGKEYLMLSDHEEVLTSELWSPFSADKCPDMAGQPILYFIQACRGPTKDHGIILMTPPGWEGDSASVSEDYVLPVDADMLIMWASYSDKPAFRDFQDKYGIEGSVFFHFLCQVLQSDSETEDLSSMLLTVTRKVGIHYETSTGLKQLPHLSSTLMRKVVFHEKLRELYKMTTSKERTTMLMEMISTKNKQKQ